MLADFNNDGQADIFFAGNVNSSALYLNKGNLIFEDVSDAAGVKTHLWCTGISIVDINQDGLLDIYVSTVHPDKDKKVPNIFFVNQGLDDKGIPQFKDLAAPLGLADSSYSTQAVFFDYDMDSDLDMYLLTNSLESYHRNTPFGCCIRTLKYGQVRYSHSASRRRRGCWNSIQTTGGRI